MRVLDDLGSHPVRAVREGRDQCETVAGTNHVQDDLETLRVDLRHTHSAREQDVAAARRVALLEEIAPGPHAATLSLRGDGKQLSGLKAGEQRHSP